MTFIESLIPVLILWLGLKYGSKIYDFAKRLGASGILIVLCLWLILLFMFYMSFGEDSAQPCGVPDGVSEFQCVEM